MRVHPFALVPLLLLAPVEARPCSVLPDSGVPLLNEVVVDAPPLLFVPDLEAALETATSTRTYGLELVERPELGRLLHQGQAMKVGRPPRDLPAGRYRIGEQSFDLRPGRRRAAEVPTVPGPEHLQLSVYSGPCGLSTLSLELPAGTPTPTTFLVVGRTPDGRTGRRLVTTEPYDPERAALTHLDDLPFTEEKVCYEVQGLALDGTLGAPVDLGCIDPNDGGDERVTHTGDGMFGCTAVNFGPELGAIALVLGLLRRRRTV